MDSVCDTIINDIINSLQQELNNELCGEYLLKYYQGNLFYIYFKSKYHAPTQRRAVPANGNGWPCVGDIEYDIVGYIEFTENRPFIKIVPFFGRAGSITYDLNDPKLFSNIIKDIKFVIEFKENMMHDP
jgi:hypothetical protein